MAYDDSACPHCRRMREELEEAREELRQARDAFSPDEDTHLRRALGLSPMEMTILTLLHRRQSMSFTALYYATYGSSEDGPGEKVIHVRISRMRARLQPHGLHIQNERGHGYYLDTGSKSILDELYRNPPEIKPIAVLRQHKGWSQSEVGALRNMWSRGFSASEISEHLSKNFGINRTRNAVLGKLDRLALIAKERATEAAQKPQHSTEEVTL